MNERERDQRDADKMTSRERAENDAYWQGRADALDGTVPVPREDDKGLEASYAMGYEDGVIDREKEAGKARGWLTGDIHQTDVWFRDEGGRS